MSTNKNMRWSSSVKREMAALLISAMALTGCSQTKPAVTEYSVSESKKFFTLTQSQVEPMLRHLNAEFMKNVKNVGEGAWEIRYDDGTEIAFHASANADGYVTDFTVMGFLDNEDADAERLVDDVYTLSFMIVDSCTNIESPKQLLADAYDNGSVIESGCYLSVRTIEDILMTTFEPEVYHEELTEALSKEDPYK